MKCISLSVLLAALLSAPAAWGASLSLDGEWQLCRTANREKPDAEWQAVTVPSFVGQLNDKPFLWYRRSFAVPKEMAGKHLFLRFQGVKFVTTVHVNGQEVGGHRGGWEPFEVDVTKACRQGANALLVRVQDVTGVIDQKMDYAKQGRGIRFISQARDSVMMPVGSQYSRVGIWQSVTLVARPDVYIEDVWVRTSVRKKEIVADVTVRNLSDRPRTVTMMALVVNAPDGTEVPMLALGYDPVAVPPGASAKRTLRQPWPKPKLWTLDAPYLYALSVELLEGRDSLDTSSTRFGFREFWTDGPDFVLNGTPMKFLATAGHPRGQIGKELGKAAAIDYYKRIREAGCVAMRLHANVWPKAWFEAADEVGMPLIMESALWCFPHEYALTKDAFWQNYHDHLRAIVRDHQNHPSIVMTSLENEILHCGGDRYAKDCEHRLAEAGRFVKTLDPTRPIMYDGDGDPEGVADVINLHYPLDFNIHNLWPDCADWLDKGMVVRGWPRKFFAWDRKKPLYFGEFLHLQHYQAPDPFTTLLGDGAYEGYDLAMARCKALAWEMQIRAYRAAGVSGMCPWTLTETGPFPSLYNPRYRAVKRAYSPIAAFIRERNERFYAGETVKRTVDLYNDTLHPAKLTVEWDLKSKDHKTLDSGRRTFDTRPAQRISFPIELKMPDLGDVALERLSVILHVRDGDGVAFVNMTLLVVFGRRTPMAPTGMRLAVFEGGEKPLSQALTAMGAKVERVSDLTKLPQAHVLVIGPHSLDGLNPPGGPPTVGGRATARDALSAYVRSGGAVIVLEQDSYDSGILPARLVDRPCSIAFPRAQNTLSYGFVPEAWLRFWRGDHVVARKTIAKPTAGRFVTYVDSGGPGGLVYLPVLEVLDGKGSYLLSQLAIGEKLGTEPAARVMLAILLDHAARMRRLNRAPVPLLVVQDGLPLTDALDEAGAIYTDVSGKLAEAKLPERGVLLVEADAGEAARNLEKLRQFVGVNRTVVLHAGTRDGIARLAKLFPEPIVAQRSTSVPVNIAESDWPIDGLTNQDLYWYGSRKGLSYRVRTPLSAEVCDHVIGTGRPKAEACGTFQAEKMAVDHGTPSLREREAYLHATAGLKTTIDFAETGEHAFIVRGRGTPVAGVYPQIAISVDGERRGSVTTADEKWGEYFLTTRVEKGKHEVMLAFVNDAYAPERGEDRNVALDWLRVGPVAPMKAKRLLNPPALVKLKVGEGTILLDQIRWDKRPGDPAAMRYLSNLLTNLNCDFHSPMTGVTLSADAFKPKEGVRLATVRDGVAYLGTNGTIATRVRFAKARRYAFAIRASGTEAKGEFPNIALSIDGRKVGNVTLRRETWHTLRLEADVAAGEHEVGLAFTNDFYDATQDPPVDRNLRIASLEIR